MITNLVLVLVALAGILLLLLQPNLVIFGLLIPAWVGVVPFALCSLLAVQLLLNKQNANRATGQQTNQGTICGNWSMSEERQFVENLFCQRFNFFIVLYSLVFAGAVSANVQWELIAVLVVGFLLCTLTGLAIYRNFVKLDWVLWRLHQEADHPLAVTARGVEPYGKLRLFPVNSIFGVWIPGLCCASLLAGAILAISGKLVAS